MITAHYPQERVAIAAEQILDRLPDASGAAALAGDIQMLSRLDEQWYAEGYGPGRGEPRVEFEGVMANHDGTPMVVKIAQATGERVYGRPIDLYALYSAHYRVLIGDQQLDVVVPSEQVGDYPSFSPDTQRYTLYDVRDKSDENLSPGMQRLVAALGRRPIVARHLDSDAACLIDGTDAANETIKAVSTAALNSGLANLSRAAVAEVATISSAPPTRFIDDLRAILRRYCF